MNSSALEAMQDFLSSREAVATAQNVFIKGSSMFVFCFFLKIKMVKSSLVKAKEVMEEIQAGSDGRVILYAGVTGNTLGNILDVWYIEIY